MKGSATKQQKKKKEKKREEVKELKGRVARHDFGEEDEQKG